MNIYKRLGIDSSADERAIKRAYAALIKQYRPESHPQEYAEIRDAYEEALYRLRHLQQDEFEDEDGEDKSGQQLNDEPDSAPNENIQYIHNVINATESAPQQPPAEDSNIVSQMIKEMAASVAQLSESELLVLYERQQEKLASLTIDLQLDYEEALRYGLLYTDHPPLKVLLEADRRYRWSEHSMEIVNMYGPDAGARYDALRKLATMYIEIQAEQNPYIQVDGQQTGNLPQICTHFLVARAKERVASWQSLCEFAGLTGYASRINFIQPRLLIYWMDVLISLISMGLGWLLVDHRNEALAEAEVVFSGLIVMLVPAILRKLAPFVFVKPMQRIKLLLVKMKIGKMAKYLSVMYKLLMLFAASMAIALMAKAKGEELFFMALGLTVIGYLFFLFYSALSSLETWLVESAIGLRKYFRRMVLREKQFADDGKTPLKWNSEIKQWIADSRLQWNSGRSSTYWWIVIWIVAMQLVRLLSNH